MVVKTILPGGVADAVRILDIMSLGGLDWDLVLLGVGVQGWLSRLYYLEEWQMRYVYSKTCLKRPLNKKDQKLFFKTNYRLMQFKSIAECSKHYAILSTPLSYHLSLRSLFCLFLSGCFTQVLLYIRVKLRRY